MIYKGKQDSVYVFNFTKIRIYKKQPKKGILCNSKEKNRRRDNILNSLNNKFLPLGLTYSAHSVACAAAVSVLDIYENEKIMENVNRIGSYTDKKVEELMNKHPSIGDWRNTGMLGCIELVKNKKNKDPLAPFNANPKQMEDMNKVIRKLRDEGMFTYTKWNYIFIAPPLTSSEEDIDEGIDIISKALKVADEFCY